MLIRSNMAAKGFLDHPFLKPTPLRNFKDKYMEIHLKWSRLPTPCIGVADFGYLAPKYFFGTFCRKILPKLTKITKILILVTWPDLISMHNASGRHTTTDITKIPTDLDYLSAIAFITPITFTVPYILGLGWWLELRWWSEVQEVLNSVMRNNSITPGTKVPITTLTPL